jgi:hypothetical protein
LGKDAESKEGELLKREQARAVRGGENSPELNSRRNLGFVVGSVFLKN